MRICLEVVGIPEDSCEQIRQAVVDAYQRLLHRNGSGPVATSLDLRGGTCPVTGRRYLSVQVHSPFPVELQTLQQFADAVYGAHPLSDDPVVREHRTVRLEDSDPGLLAGMGSDPGPFHEEISCWLCGRFDGEEYSDPASGAPRSLQVLNDVPGRVPLCTVCRRLLEGRGTAP